MKVAYKTNWDIACIYRENWEIAYKFNHFLAYKNYINLFSNFMLVSGIDTIST